MTPKGAITSLTRALGHIGRTGEPPDIDAYLASPQFRQAMSVIIMTHEHYKTFAKALTEAQQEIARRRPLPAPGSKRVRWDEARVTRLRNAWRRHRGNLWRVARELGITENAAEAAYNRFVVGGATPTGAQKAVLEAAGASGPVAPSRLALSTTDAGHGSTAA